MQSIKPYKNVERFEGDIMRDIRKSAALDTSLRDEGFYYWGKRMRKECWRRNRDTQVHGISERYDRMHHKDV